MSMKTYAGTKIIHAMKIAELHIRETGDEAVETKAYLVGERDDAGQQTTVIVSQRYLNKHAPVVGGYYIRYPDGYESFSPAKTFEAAYRPLTTDEHQLIKSRSA